MALDARHRYIAKLLAKLYDVPKQKIENYLAEKDVLKTTLDFFQPNSDTQKLLFFRQTTTHSNNEQSDEDEQSDDAKVLFLTTGEVDQQRGTAIYFLRTKPDQGVGVATAEQDLCFGVLGPNPLEHLNVSLSEVFLPFIKQASANWDPSTGEDFASEFFSTYGKFCNSLTEAVGTLKGGFMLKRPERFMDIDFKPAAIARAGSDTEIVSAFESVLDEWCTGIEKVVSQSDASRRESDEAGPKSELDYWKNRMAQINSVSEQLKGHDCKLVVAVLSAAKSKGLKRWKFVENSITDANHEAKDNVKYLSSLEKYLDPLSSGTPGVIMDNLPGLLNNIKMMHTIARYYNTTERMTLLFRKITNEMISTCKRHIESHGGQSDLTKMKLWDQPVLELVEKLQASAALFESYKEQYLLTRDKLLLQPRGKQFDFSEQAIFGKADLFCRRLDKLIDMFSTIDQFSNLATHKIEGMEGLIESFWGIVNELRVKPYDILDYEQSQFDRDILEFNASIQELETSLQGFLNASFENITSTEQALGMLKQFQAILQRASLKEDLESKLMVIFHNYGLDLETVQRLYEKHKSAPPFARNLPPVTGAIVWARQLLRRIEEPMQKFQADSNLMATQEGKKIVKLYNRIARTIVEFETLWHMAWMNQIDASKTGLNATLIIRHPSNDRLYVNFDREILQLIRESKSLMRLGIEVPETARIVLLQEDKFKSYYNELSYSISQYDSVISRIMPQTASLLKPHLLDMERKMQPGMVTLTWTSMNIDGYLHRVHSGLFRLDDLVSKTRDIIENRIERNLKIISRISLVDLPDHETFQLDRFVAVQERHVREQTAIMAAKSHEIEESVDDLIELISEYPLEHGIAPTPHAERKRLKDHYARLMYRAVLNASKSGLAAVKQRVGSRALGGILFLDQPFFTVNVELTIPSVSMTPSLEDIQSAINRSSRALLGASKQIPLWSGTDVFSKISEATTMFDLIAKDKEIVKTVLLLTGSVEGAKRQVNDYLF